MIIPPRYNITPEIIELLGKIEAVRQYFLAIKISPTIVRKIEKMSLLKSSLYSAKIEGNPLSFNDLKNASDKIKRLEIENIEKALIFIKNLKTKSINESLIKRLHKIVMNKINYQAGFFRKEISAIFNQAGIAVYLPPPPSKIIQLIGQLVYYINNDYEKFPLIKGFIAHLVFEKIHPFLDGNGRVGRLLIPLILKIKKYDFKISVSFEEYLNENKSDYYYFLDTGLKNPNDYLVFMLKSFYRQTEKLKSQIEKEINKKYFVFLPPRQEEIFNIIKDHRVVSFDFIKRRFLKIPSRTLRYDLKKLAEKKLIIKIGKTRGSYYQIFNK